MKLAASDPDIETLYRRMQRDEIDLQPGFQRSVVWSVEKKQRLIDTILREWHVPPVHLIAEADGAVQQVLDGQQRLTAIRDFMSDTFPVYGLTEPVSPDIQRLDGMRYSELPFEVRRRFNQYTLRVIRITDYRPSEPGELFFRLNQQITLTSAEARNAFFGPTRQQVKELVAHLIAVGLDSSFIGFSNMRMAYDDIIARVCVTFETATLSQKITSTLLADRYRSSEPFPPEAIASCRASIDLLGEIARTVRARPRFNKSTLFTWLVFAASLRPLARRSEELAKYLDWFEAVREAAKRPQFEIGLPFVSSYIDPQFTRGLIQIYEDRAASRVADVSSVLLRDAALWALFSSYSSGLPPGAPLLFRKYRLLREAGPRSSDTPQSYLERVIARDEWAVVP